MRRYILPLLILVTGCSSSQLSPYGTAKPLSPFATRVLFNDRSEPTDEPAVLASVDEALAHVQRALAKETATTGSVLAIASPRDQGGRLRQTAFSLWLLERFDARARAAGFKTLPLTAGRLTSARLTPHKTIIDTLFSMRPEELENTERWRDINRTLLRRGKMPVNAVLTTRVMLGAGGRRLFVHFKLLRLGKDPQVVANGRFPVSLSEAIPTGADVMLLVDVSASMRSNDPAGMRLSAVRFLLAELAEAQRANKSANYTMGVVFFSDKNRWYSIDKPVSLAKQANVDRLEDGLQHVFASGETNLDKPFGPVLAHLAKGKLHRPLVVVVLTDGNHTAGPPRHTYRQIGHVLKKTYRPVSGYVIGLGLEPRSRTLRQIALSLGGTTSIQRLTPGRVGERFTELLFGLHQRDIERRVKLLDRRVEVGHRLPVTIDSDRAVISISTLAPRPGGVGTSGAADKGKGAGEPPPINPLRTISVLDHLQ